MASLFTEMSGVKTCELEGKEVGVMLLDFDWAGKEKTVRYPDFLNRAVWMSSGPKDAALITKTHDNDTVDHMFRLGKPPVAFDLTIFLVRDILNRIHGISRAHSKGMSIQTEMWRVAMERGLVSVSAKMSRQPPEYRVSVVFVDDPKFFHIRLNLTSSVFDYQELVKKTSESECADVNSQALWFLGEYSSSDSSRDFAQ